MGSLSHYISNTAIEDFQPMNINFGLLPPLDRKVRKKKLRNEQLAQRSLEAFSRVVDSCNENLVCTK